MASSSFPISTDVHVPQYQLLVRSCPKVSMFAEPSVQDNIVEPSEEVIYLSDSVACLPFKDEAPLKLSKMDHTPPAQISKIDLTRDSMEPISRLDSFSREPLTLHTADLEEKKHSLLTTDSEIQTLERPYYASSPKYFGSQERKARSPVHSLLTAPLCDTHVDGTAESHHFLGENCSDSFAHEVTNDSRQDIQHRLEYLQRFAEDLEMKNKEMLLLMRNYGKADTEIDKLKCSDQIKPA
ncbi:coiled-coil domain-containing protein 158-like [Hyperolius riggenbachi]|uniref:coiled-coil domain-containing protein 158-like n=1 Tax=Hyperolius riggenbachi TaxID=752182 RepID=UPI0035A39985